MRLNDTTNQMIVKIICDYIEYFKKSYCYPAQETFLLNLEQFHGIKICLRTLNYRLKELEDKGYIKRFQRHTKDANGMIICRSTAYYLGHKIDEFMKAIKRIAFKTLNWCGLQRLAINYKKSKDLLFKDTAKGGKVVNNLSFNSS